MAFKSVLAEVFNALLYSEDKAEIRKDYPFNEGDGMFSPAASVCGRSPTVLLGVKVIFICKLLYTVQSIHTMYTYSLYMIFYTAISSLRPQRQSRAHVRRGTLHTLLCKNDQC